MTASTLCMIAERRGAPYADAQLGPLWPLGRYGRCIVKGYPSDLTRDVLAIVS